MVSSSGSIRYCSLHARAIDVGIEVELPALCLHYGNTVPRDFFLSSMASRLAR